MRSLFFFLCLFLVFSCQKDPAPTEKEIFLTKVAGEDYQQYLRSPIDSIVPSVNQPIGQLGLGTKHLQFDSLMVGEEKQIEVNFVNIGQTDISIYDVESTIDYNSINYSKAPLSKGEKGSINITFKSSVAGPYRRSVWIHSNTNPAINQIIISGYVFSPPKE